MRVFKYRCGSEGSLRRDLRTLYENKIYAAPVESLNDLFEAMVTIDGHTFKIGNLLSRFGTVTYTEKLKEAEEKFLEYLQSFVRGAKKWGVYSLSATATDELLWAYYGDSHRGFCIEYDLNQLISYKLESQHWTKVIYQDDVPEITMRDLLGLEDSHEPITKKLIGTKSQRWAHEREIRVVTGQPGSFEHDFRATKSIYFGARSSQHLRRRVMRAMAGRGISYYRVGAEGKGYSLAAMPIEDLFEREPAYRVRRAPVEDGVPYWDEKTAPYKEEILQAIELVRRDPYCERVTDAYLSSRGTVENPVFYVTYDRSDGLPRNFHISKSDLDQSN